jgi:hypothetical protein
MSCGVEVIAELIAMGSDETITSEQRARLVQKRRGSHSPFHCHDFGGEIEMFVDEHHLSSNRVEGETDSCSTADDDK